MTQSTRTTASLLAALSLLAASVASAQTEPSLKDVIGADEPQAEEQSPATSPEPSHAQHAAAAGPVDDFDRGVPRTSIKGYFEAAHQGDWKQAAEYLDLRNLPPSMRPVDGVDLARKLKIVLDRTLWIDPADLSGEPGGYADDGLPPYRDALGVIDMPDGKVQLWLQRVPREDGVGVWKISNRSVAQIPALYGHYGYGLVGERLSLLLPDIRFFGLLLWQWVGIIGLILASTRQRAPTAPSEPGPTARATYAEVATAFLEAPGVG